MTQSPADTGSHRSPQSLSELVQWLCRDTVALMHVNERIIRSGSDVGNLNRMLLLGQILGLRQALCRVKGWDPVGDVDKDDRSDQFIRNWHNLPGHCNEPDCGMW